MTEISDSTIEQGHRKGERTHGSEARATNAERHAISDESKNLTPAFAGLETNSGFSFRQHSVRISRGARHAIIDVEVSFLYRAEVPPDKYPDVRELVLDTLAFLQNYPENRAYWEIYARDAASKLFKEYGVFSSLTVTLVIHPDDLRAYLRTATAAVVAAAGGPSHSGGTERCALVSTNSSSSGTTFRNTVGQQALRGRRASTSVTPCSRTGRGPQAWRLEFGAPAIGLPAAPRPGAWWEEMRMQQIAGAATAFLFASLAPALVMASFWYTAKIASTAFVLTFAIAMVHAVLVGLPLFLACRSKAWINVMSCVAFGFVVGAAPTGVLTWPMQHPELHASVAVDGVPTLISGIITAAGWGSYVKPLIYFGSFGALGGFAFWAALMSSGTL
jgi:hypothetical protein